MSILKEIKNKKVLILGFGLEGKSTLSFLRANFPQKILGIADLLPFEKIPKNYQKIIKKDKFLKLHLGKKYLEALKNYEIIIKSPGIPWRVLKPYLKKNQRITSQTEIFLEEFPGLTIGVTGTKGKSTTAALIYHLLKKAGFRVVLVGNIEKPMLSFLQKNKKFDVAVMELSSHQLFKIKRSPRFAVLLNIFPEHLDYYQSFKEYINAKATITKYQSEKDYLFFDAQNNIVKEIAQKSKAQKIPLKIDKIKKMIISQKIPLSSLYLKNIAAAFEVCLALNVPSKKILAFLKTFKTLKHRLELVGTFQGITFYNDSLSTIPQTTMAAIENLGNKVETLILGGFDRGVSFKELAEFIVKRKHLKNIIFFPESGERIWQEIQKLKEKISFKPYFVKEMKECVQIAYEKTGKNKICLLSPASPSFGIFKNYKERGNLFKKYILKLSGNQKIKTSNGK
jgi:UDP-N-acetylmuramoylalanine--D-glutamate ligase